MKVLRRKVSVYGIQISEDHNIVVISCRQIFVQQEAQDQFMMLLSKLGFFLCQVWYFMG